MKRLLLLLCIILLSSAVSSHKESPETITLTDKYDIRIGLIPNQMVEGEEQKIYLTMRTLVDKTPVSEFGVRFFLYNTHLGVRSSLIRIVDAVETEPGRYEITHTFPSKGAYEAAIEIYDNGVKIVDVSKNLFVEPNGPSPLFWAFMILTLIIAIYIARMSDAI